MTSLSDKGGMITGKSHAQGGEHFVVEETNQRIEAEGGEPVIPNEAFSHTTQKTLQGTNTDIINSINKSIGAKSLSEKADVLSPGDAIICKKAPKDKTKKTIKGTNRQIVSAINVEAGCNEIETGATITDNSGTQQYNEGGKVIEGEGLAHILLKVASRNYENMIDKLQDMNVNHRRESENIIKVYTDPTSGWHGNSKAQYKLMHDIWVDKFIEKDYAEGGETESVSWLGFRKGDFIVNNHTIRVRQIEEKGALIDFVDIKSDFRENTFRVVRTNCNEKRRTMCEVVLSPIERKGVFYEYSVHKEDYLESNTFTKIKTANTPMWRRRTQYGWKGAEGGIIDEDSDNKVAEQIQENSEKIAQGKDWDELGEFRLIRENLITNPHRILYVRHKDKIGNYMKTNIPYRIVNVKQDGEGGYTIITNSLLNWNPKKWSNLITFFHITSRPEIKYFINGQLVVKEKREHSIGDKEGKKLEKSVAITLNPPEKDTISTAKLDEDKVPMWQRRIQYGWKGAEGGEVERMSDEKLAELIRINEAKGYTQKDKVLQAKLIKKNLLTKPYRSVDVWKEFEMMVEKKGTLPMGSYSIVDIKAQEEANTNDPRYALVVSSGSDSSKKKIIVNNENLVYFLQGDLVVLNSYLHEGDGWNEYQVKLNKNIERKENADNIPMWQRRTKYGWKGEKGGRLHLLKSLQSQLWNNNRRIGDKEYNEIVRELNLPEMFAEGGQINIRKDDFSHLTPTQQMAKMVYFMTTLNNINERFKSVSSIQDKIKLKNITILNTEGEEQQIKKVEFNGIAIGYLYESVSKNETLYSFVSKPEQIGRKAFNFRTMSEFKYWISILFSKFVGLI